MEVSRSIRAAAAAVALLGSLAAGQAAGVELRDLRSGAEADVLQITPGGPAAAVLPSDAAGQPDHAAPRLRWRDMLFLNTLDGVGYSMLAGDNYRLGVKSTDEPFREYGPGDMLWSFGAPDRARNVGAFGQYSLFDHWTVEASVNRALTGGNGGLMADVGVKWNTRLGEGWFVEVGPSVSWAAGDYVQGLFGPDSRGVGLQLYDAGPGFKDVTVSGAVSYSLSDTWTVGGMIGAQRFLGDVGGGPTTIPEDSIFGGISFGFRF